MCTLASMSLLTAFISRPRSLLPKHRLVSKENPLSLRPAQSHTAEPTAPPQGLSQHVLSGFACATSSSCCSLT